MSIRKVRQDAVPFRFKWGVIGITKRIHAHGFSGAGMNPPHYIIYSAGKGLEGLFRPQGQDGFHEFLGNVQVRQFVLENDSVRTGIQHPEGVFHGADSAG